MMIGSKKESGCFDLFYLLSFYIFIFTIINKNKSIIIMNHLGISNKFFSIDTVILVVNSFSFLDGQNIQLNGSKHSLFSVNQVYIMKDLLFI